MFLCFPFSKDLIEQIEFVDILIVHIDSMEYFNIIEKYLKRTYTIFIINDNSDLKNILILKNMIFYITL